MPPLIDCVAERGDGLPTLVQTHMNGTRAAQHALASKEQNYHHHRDGDVGEVGEVGDFPSCSINPSYLPYTRLTPLCSQFTKSVGAREGACG